MKSRPNTLPFSPASCTFGKSVYDDKGDSFSKSVYRHIIHTNHIVHNLFNVCSNYRMFALQRARIQNTQFAVSISDSPVTLKQSQGHKT